MQRSSTSLLSPKAPSAAAPPLRVLQIGMGWLPDTPGNGLDRVYYNLATALPAVGVDVHGLVTGSSDPSKTHPQVRTVISTSSSLPRRLSAFRRAVRRKLQSTRIDVVASHFALYAAAGLDLIPPRPLVVHFHGPWAHESEIEGEPGFAVGLKKWVERAVYRRGRRFIVLSNAFREVLITQYDVPADRIRIVPGGVETARFNTGYSRSDARTRLGWPTDRPIVIAVRRLVQRVGIDHLITAMKRVRARVPDALLLIAGAGPLRSSFEQQVAAAELSQHVRFLGFVPDEDLPLAYRAANISVMPSLALEGFGLSAVESLAAGTPVFVTPVGGLPDIVRDLSEDLLLPSAKPAVLADRLIAALTGALSLPSTTDCQSYAQSRYDWSTVAAQTHTVYQEALS